MKKKLLVAAFGLALALGGIGIATAVHTYASTETQMTEELESNSQMRLLSNSDTTTESTYEIKEIKKIYTPSSIDGTRLPSRMSDFMCTKDGEIFKDYGFVVGTTARSNTEDYEFSLSAYINPFSYNKEIPVEITPYDYKMGYVEFEDGDIAVLYNIGEEYSYSQIMEGITMFFNDQGISTEGLKIPNSSYYITKTYEGSYSGGKIYLIPSGVNIYFTSPSQPTDQSNYKKGYVCLDCLSYTKEFTRAQALEIIKKQSLLKDGVLVDNFDVTFEEREGSNYVTAIYTVNGEQVLKNTINCRQIESTYSYVMARSYFFDYAYIAVPKQESNPYSLNQFMADVIKTFRTIIGKFNNTTSIDFTKLSKADVDGVYRVGNGSYYSYEYNVEIINYTPVEDETNPEVGVPPTDDTEINTDELDLGNSNLIDNFKKNFEENNAFKVATLILGSLTGVLLIWGIYALIRKIIKWLSK